MQTILQEGAFTSDIRNAINANFASVGVPFGTSWFVDGDSGSNVGNSGQSASAPFSTIQYAVNQASANDTIFIKARKMLAGATDPVNYAETIIIPANKGGLRLIGWGAGRTQGGLPQIKKGSGSTALLTVRAPGCLIANLCFNGGSSTGGGILFDDDGSTKSAFGTVIYNCYFKNCAGSTATDARTGGAIQWASTGGAWQVLIKGNRFFKNVGDIVLLGTSLSVPEDVVIEDNIFSGPAASTDCNVYLSAGSGMTGVVIRNCNFQQLPNIGSGSVKRYLSMTGCTGMLVGCTFGCQTAATGGTRITFKVGGTGAEIPTTVHIASCYGQSITASETAEISIA